MYYREVRSLIMSYMKNEVKLSKIIKDINGLFNEFVSHKEYKYLKYRTINDVFYEIKDIDEYIIDTDNLNSEETKIVNNIFENCLCMIDKKVKYCESYIVNIEKESILNFSDLLEKIDKVSNLQVVDLEKIKLLEQKIIKNIMIEDIICSEIYKSIITICNSIKNNNYNIPQLGIGTVNYTVHDEIYYLLKLKKVICGEIPIKYSGEFLGDEIVYTNFLLITN